MQPTNIEYLDQTWNPIAMRCTPVSSGCSNCWHLKMANRMQSNPLMDCHCKMAYASDGDPWLRTKELSVPLRRNKPTRIGVQFMGDLFHESIPFEWIAAVYGCMAAAPQHQFFVLTKRPERRFKFMKFVDDFAFENEVYDDDDEPMNLSESEACINELLSYEPESGRAPWPREGPPWPLPNVLEGVSVEDQKTADERIPFLLDTTASKRWVSYEPALSGIEFQRNNGWLEPFQEFDPMLNRYSHLDLIVAGSETGPGARPTDLDWFRSTRDQCAEAGVAFFLKQVAPGVRELDGVKHEELP